MPKKARTKIENKAAPIAPAKEPGQKARPAAPAARPASDVLVLHDLASKVPTTPGVESLEWIYAVGPDSGRLSDFKYVICFSGVMGSDDARRELAVKVQGCIRAGARVLFLIHAAPKGFDEWSIGHLASTKELLCKPDCSRDRQLIYMSIGMDVVYVGKEGRQPPRPAGGVPTGVLDAHMAKYPSNFRVVNCSDLALAGDEPATCLPLWEWGVTEREPAAATGVLGRGEWLVLPGPAEPYKCDMVELVRLVKTMDGWATRASPSSTPPPKSGAMGVARTAGEGEGSKQPPKGIEPEPSRRHESDFGWVEWDGEPYIFKKPQQRAVVKALWADYERRGHGLTTKAINQVVGSESDRFRVEHVFRESGGEMHPAWRTLIVKVQRGIYRLGAHPGRPATS